VNAYMAQDSLVDRVNRGLLDMSADEAVAQYKKAIEGGLLKIISKMGISVGLYRVRAKGERHAYKAEMIHMLQEAVGREDYELYKKYADVVNSEKPIQIRDLLDFKPAGKPMPLRTLR